MPAGLARSRAAMALARRLARPLSARLSARPPPAPSLSSASRVAGRIDLWGRIRRLAESDRASMQASEAALAGARLAAQAELAIDYFELRAQDQLQIILNDIVAAEQQSLRSPKTATVSVLPQRPTSSAHRPNFCPARAQQVNAPLQRAILEHAIAVLVGQQPANFSVAPAALRDGCSNGSGGNPIHAARKAARRGRGGTAGCRGQCADRRGHLGFLSHPRHYRLRRLPGETPSAA